MKRRNFLKGAGLALGAAGIGGAAGLHTVNAKISKDTDASVLPAGSKQWSNWSGHQTCTPERFWMPASEEELAQHLKTTAGKLRVVGGGHSFSPVVPTDGTLASLKHLKGIVSHDPATQLATIRAGSHLFELTDEMLAASYSFANQGDVDRQSLAGAVSTSTHGTGKDLTSFAGMVKGFRLATASGELIDCDAQNNPELFFGGVVGLGALGIVTQYTMQLMPKYKLREHVYPAKVQDILDGFHELSAQHRHFELWPFLHSDTCLVKTLDITDEPETPVQEPFPSDDFLLALGLTLSGESPARLKKVMNLLSGLLEETRRVGWAQRIFPSLRNVKFNEMEYEIPMEKGVACMRELLETGRKLDFPIFFPFEMRTVRRDECWMSPFYQQDSIAISAHQFHQYDFERYFPVFHEVMKKYGGRPHWGKLTYYTKAEITALYPKYPDFVRLKKELDPAGRFSNTYISKYFD